MELHVRKPRGTEKHPYLPVGLHVGAHVQEQEQENEHRLRAHMRVQGPRLRAYMRGAQGQEQEMSRINAKFPNFVLKFFGGGPGQPRRRPEGMVRRILY